MRAATLVLGLLTLAAVWTLPLERMLPGPFSSFMVTHMGVVAVAAPLLALAVSGSRLDPVGRIPVLFAPLRAAALELIVVWAWHAPALHEAARASAGVLALEQTSFLTAGLVVWLSALGGRPVPGGPRSAAGVVALLLTSMHMTLLGALLALPPRALYAHPSGAADPLADQHLGGAIMLVAGGVSYLAGGLALTRSLLVERRLREAGGGGARPAGALTGRAPAPGGPA